MLVLLALVVLWAVFRGGDESTSEEGKGGGGPAATITPGPSDSGPAISERPGGRDEGDAKNPGADPSSGADSGGGGGDAADEGTAGGSGWGNGGAAGAGSGGLGGSDGGGRDTSGGGGSVSAGSALPACRTDDVAVSLRSVAKRYRGSEQPKFVLTAKNSRETACKLDLGLTSSVVTVRDAEGDEVWASDHCPAKKGSAFVRLSAGSTSTHTLTWYRKANADNCATGRQEAAPAGAYRVEVDLKGLTKVHADFTLA